MASMMMSTETQAMSASMCLAAGSGCSSKGNPKHVEEELALVAAGVGYALCCSDRRARSIAACFFGEGAASEGVRVRLATSFTDPDALPADFPAGLLLASTIPSPTLLVACNVGSIGTVGVPFVASSACQVIIHVHVHNYELMVTTFSRRSPPFGRRARGHSNKVRRGHKLPQPAACSELGYLKWAMPTLVIRQWVITDRIARLRLYLESQGLCNATAEELRTRLKVDVMQALKHAESLTRCELGELFTDVYGWKEPISPRKEPSWRDF
ncbi:hypothetical protein C8J57DRAFT_1246103 [Mycena rebaudengoi]|nr:hypothetical protein C8J57DRAFT_1246103 [Mycena rebaudengoi]